MIKVLVVDDSLFMRRLISDMLNSDPEIKVAWTAKNGAEFISRAFMLHDVLSMLGVPSFFPANDP